MIWGPECCVPRAACCVLPRRESWSVVRLFTDARVPTGMNTGVSMTPCGVSIRPRRAAPSFCRSSNVSRVSALSTRHSALSLDLHLLDLHVRRKGDGKAARRHRLVDADVAELVARDVAVAFDVLDLAGEIRVLVDGELDALHAPGHGAVLRRQVEHPHRLRLRVGEGEVEVAGQLVDRAG